MTEVQRVPDAEPAEPQDLERTYEEAQVLDGDEQRSYQDRVQDVISKSQGILDEHFEIAREFAEVRVVYGAGSVEQFAKDCQMSRSTGYVYRGVWLQWGEDWKNGELPRNVHWSHYVATFNRLPPEERKAAIEEAADEERTTRQHEAALEGRDAPKNVEMVHVCECPECFSIFKLRRARQWEEKAE